MNAARPYVSWLQRSGSTGLLLVLAIAGCGGGGGDDSGAPPAAVAPTVTLASSATGVSNAATFTLNWSSTNARACVASGGWSGAKPATGSETIGPIGAATTFQLTCAGDGGEAGATASVAVTSTVADCSANEALAFGAQLRTFPVGVNGRRFEVTSPTSDMNLLGYNLTQTGKICVEAAVLRQSGACAIVKASCSEAAGDDAHLQLKPGSAAQKVFVRYFPADGAAQPYVEACVRGASATAQPCDSQNFVIAGIASDAAGLPLKDVTARIIAADLAYTNVSGADGFYLLRVPKATLPQTFVYSLYRSIAPQIVPRSLSGKQSGYYMTSAPKLDAISASYVVVEIEPIVHHIGDSNFGGTVNSQFQRAAAEGTQFAKTFSVTAASLAFAKAELSFLAKGVECEDEILINNKSLGVLPRSPADGSYTEIGHTFAPKSILTVGTNTVIVRSSKNCVAAGGGTNDFDDFEFENVLIHFAD